MKTEMETKQAFDIRSTIGLSATIEHSTEALWTHFYMTQELRLDHGRGADTGKRARARESIEERWAKNSEEPV